MKKKQISKDKKRPLFLNKKQRERRRFIEEIRNLVIKARGGDSLATELLHQKCKEDVEYQQIAKRIIDFLDMDKKKAVFSKVDYKKESSQYLHWPMKN